MDVPVATLQFEVKGGEVMEINLGTLVINKAKGLGDATVAIAMMSPSSDFKWKRQGVSSFLF